MKKLFLIITLLTFNFELLTVAHAATSTPTPVEQQIDELKDRIASRVAQLKLVERRGIIGVVMDLSDTQINLTDVKGNTRFVDVDELTKFTPTSNTNDSFGISDIEKGQTLGVLGLYNKQSRRILARSILQISYSKMVNGNIATIDPDNFVFNIATDKNEQLKISVETTTKTFSYDKESQELVRSGFSKLKENEKVFVKGHEDKKEEKKISADVIIHFPDIVKSSPVQELKTPVPSPVTSTGSGKKLTPITK